MTIANFIRKKLGLKLVYRDPEIVAKYCKGSGIEVGGASHRTFYFHAINVDISDHISAEDIYAKAQLQLENSVKKVDIIASGDNIPLADGSVDFVFSSHVLEHFFDPVSALDEWLRLVKNNKYVVCIIPHKERTFDRDRECTPIEEFESRHKIYKKSLEYPDKHYSVWTTETFLKFAEHFNYQVVAVDDEVFRIENSFAVAIKKQPIKEKASY